MSGNTAPPKQEPEKIIPPARPADFVIGELRTRTKGTWNDGIDLCACQTIRRGGRRLVSTEFRRIVRNRLLETK